MPPSSEIKAGGTRIAVSNLDKVFYPKTGFRKGDVLDYYIQVSQWLLPHLKNRPITLKRYPNGVDAPFFYQKQCPPNRPRDVRTTTVKKKHGGEVTYCIINNLEALVWAVNLADLELHSFLHKAPALDRPTAMAFDLDPGPPADILTCCHVALELRKILSKMGLEALAKTSGSKGLQVYVPLNIPVTYAKTKAFAHAMATLLEKQLADLVVSKMQKHLRTGKVFIDWSQNDDHKTTVAVYSLRARESPTVSTPVAWEEIERAQKQKKASLLTFEPSEVVRRARKLGDLFAPVLKMRQRLPSLAAVSA